MKFAFRWYGDDDGVTLENIRQISCVTSVVSACYDNAPGDVWNVESIKHLKSSIEDNEMTFDVVEGVPIHEDIKLGMGQRDLYIQNYIENLRRLANENVKVVCYNFMPIFGWIRTDLNRQLEDKSSSIAYCQAVLEKLDPTANDFKLPGWHFSSKKDEISKLIAQYQALGVEGLWRNLEYFLKAVVPQAEKFNIKLAIHPDDPPLPVFGIPRIVSTIEDLRRITNIVDNQFNGITLCIGSLGANRKNNLIEITNEFMEKKRIHFVHARNLKWENDIDFVETGHMTHVGNLNMGNIVKILAKHNYKGCIRSDHGRMIWGETGRVGYGLFDRALGISYLSGLWEGISL